MNLEPVKKFVQLFAGATQSLRLYPRNHPLVGQQIENCRAILTPLLARQKTLRLGLTDGILFCGEYLFSDPNPAMMELAGLLDNLQVAGIEFQDGIGQSELKEFLFLAAEGGWQSLGLEQTLLRKNIDHIVPLDQEFGSKNPREIYNRALRVVQKIFNEVRLGKVPSSHQAQKSVEEMVESTLENPHALVALSLIKDYDNYTFHHSVNVAVIAIAVGRACGVSEREMRILGLGGLLHDLGKLKVDVQIINKPGRLTLEEFEVVKKHPEHGASIVEQMEGTTSEVVDIVLGHHLHFNRRGYPDDLAGRSLSPLADMAAIADSYDAITTMRSYRRPVSPRQAIREMKATSGTLLHPEFLEKFLENLGPYPVGTVVRLQGDEIALVVKTETEGTRNLRLKILFDHSGNPAPDNQYLDLPESETARIVSEIDPFLIGVNLNDHF